MLMFIKLHSSQNIYWNVLNTTSNVTAPNPSVRFSMYTYTATNPTHPYTVGPISQARPRSSDPHQNPTQKNCTLKNNINFRPYRWGHFQSQNYDRFYAHTFTSNEGHFCTAIFRMVNFLVNGSLKIRQLILVSAISRCVVICCLQKQTYQLYVDLNFWLMDLFNFASYKINILCLLMNSVLYIIILCRFLFPINWCVFFTHSINSLIGGDNVSRWWIQVW